MLKKYIAKSHISICVTFANGGHKHISFSPKTNGGSVYYTNDEQEQNALESHHKFGKLFKAEAVAPVVASKPVEKKTSAPVAPVKKEPAIVEIKVNDLNEAKDYLCEKFGLSRTKLRSTKSITDAAAANHVVFIGL